MSDENLTLSDTTRPTVIDEGGTGKPITLYEPDDFQAMHAAGKLAAMTLDHITPFVQPGVSTGELDRVIEAFMRDQGGIPATIGYRGYPKASCISKNHVVNHGIPGDGPKDKLVKGDIVNIDVTVILDGWHGDTSRMYILGESCSVKARKLVDVTFECMWAGIEAVRPGNTLGDIGHAIQYLAEKNRFSVVREFVGHGIGQVFHDAPEVRHYGKPGDGVTLQPGMIFTIEPMINAGKAAVKIKEDGWTTVTKDRSLSAQFEHTVGVTETGYEVFTHSPAGLDRPPYS